jgi:hypothetical protein
VGQRQRAEKINEIKYLQLLFDASSVKNCFKNKNLHVPLKVKPEMPGGTQNAPYSMP